MLIYFFTLKVAKLDSKFIYRPTGFSDCFYHLHGVYKLSIYPIFGFRLIIGLYTLQFLLAYIMEAEKESQAIYRAYSVYDYPA